MEFQSDIHRLTAFAGSQSYGPLTGGEDYRELSNRVTTDLIRMYGLIEGLTTENPWDVPTRLRGLKVEPRHRCSCGEIRGDSEKRNRVTPSGKVLGLARRTFVCTQTPTI